MAVMFTLRCASTARTPGGYTAARETWGTGLGASEPTEGGACVITAPGAWPGAAESSLPVRPARLASPTIAARIIQMG